ncbi:MAG: TetR/AcrR family transcriptional regulator [Chloroflexi bacterium]|nr:TetR/AcrR family transcriptional regulator [Chloroflexota bacterium]
MTIRPPSFNDRVRAERRRFVLDAARRLFVTQGYAGTTVDAIADAAGVGKGTVYLHFATKDDLLLHLITEATEQLLRQIGEIMAAGRPAPDQLAASLRVCADSYRDNHDLVTMNLPALRTVFGNRLAAEPPAAAILRQLAQIVRQGQQEGSVRTDLDPDTVGMLVLTLAQIPSSLRELHRAADDGADASLEQTLGVLLQGIVPPSAAL